MLSWTRVGQTSCRSFLKAASGVRVGRAARRWRGDRRPCLPRAENTASAGARAASPAVRSRISTPTRARCTSSARRSSSSAHARRVALVRLTALSATSCRMATASRCSTPAELKASSFTCFTHERAVANLVLICILLYFLVPHDHQCWIGLQFLLNLPVVTPSKVSCSRKKRQDCTLSKYSQCLSSVCFVEINLRHFCFPISAHGRGFGLVRSPTLLGPACVVQA